MGAVTFPLRYYLSQETPVTQRNTLSVCYRTPLAIKSKLPETSFSTSNEGGMKSLESLFQANLQESLCEGFICLHKIL